MQKSKVWHDCGSAADAIRQQSRGTVRPPASAIMSLTSKVVSRVPALSSSSIILSPRYDLAAKSLQPHRTVIKQRQRSTSA